MSTCPQHDVLMIGLPEAGKSTFLAALWELLDSGLVTNALRLGSVAHTDRTYLNRIREQWVRCEPLSHTTVQDEHLINIPLLATDGESLVLAVPDLSGETFERHWTERQWLPEFKPLAERATGCLLFVNPLRIREPHPIESATTAAAALHGVVLGMDATAEGEGEQGGIVPWDPSLSPTQVILVDLLQSLLRSKCGCEFRVAIVISAWDAVRDQGLTPDAWLETHLPLLWQYTTSNSDTFAVRIFGVSAQGGDLSAMRDSLLNTDAPSDRLACTAGNEQSKDISLPLKWSIGVQ